MITVLQIFPNYMTHGGMESFLMNYFRHRDKKNINFVFLQLSSKKGEFDDEILNDGGYIEYYSRNQHNIFAYSRFLKAIITKHHIDIVHVHGDAFSTMTFICLKRIGFKKVIAHSHNTNQQSRFLLSIKKRIATKYSLYHFACSKEAGEWLFGLKACSDSHFKIISNAIEEKRYKFSEENRKRIREQYNLADKKVIGCVGHLEDYHKNQSFLIKLLKRINNNKYYLMLIGDGSDLQFLKRLANESGLCDKVIFINGISDASSFYSAFDAFCLASHYEGLGIVCVEAIANGLMPIISTNVPKIPELSKFEIAVDASEDNFDEWIDAIEKTYRDSSLFESVKNSSFSIDNASKELFKIYCNILGENDE